jgi:hypothetical protein
MSATVSELDSNGIERFHFLMPSPYEILHGHMTHAGLESCIRRLQVRNKGFQFLNRELTQL